jgi:penicillin-binding protein 2
MDTDSNQVRLGALGIVAVALFLALFARLWFLQGIERQEFEAASVSNRLRVIHTEGPRGRILDRNGRVIVDNRTSVVVALDREPLRERVSGLDERDPADLARMEEELRPTFAHMAEALSSLGIPTTADDVWERFADKRYSPQEPVPVAEDVSTEVEQYLLERAAEFPGVIVERRSVREYPHGSLAAHLVGYVGEINEEELTDRGGTLPGGDVEASVTTTTAPGSTAKGYELGDSIGKTGVERAYEDHLRAVPGQRTIEVNAKGEMLDVVSENPPVPGDDVWLSIDLDLQAQAERLLAERIESLRGSTDRGGRPTKAPQGSVVVTDPVTGQVLAMASYPTYDPSAIVNGISSEMWAAFQDPASGLPLNNWVMQGTYAPGSTFKPFTAVAGLRTGFLRPGNDTYSDSGVYRLQGCKGQKCEFQNAGRQAHGSVNLPRSLTVSSDTYYYRIGEQLWLSRDATGQTPIQDVAREFGLGEATGIELRGEAKGRIPTPASRQAAHDENPEAFPNPEWYTGDNVITAIGQGDVLVTPLQLVNAYGTLANGGSVMRPHVVHQITRPLDVTRPPGEAGNFEVVRAVEPEVVRRVELPGDQLVRIVQGLVGVTQSPEGTARSSWSDTPTAWPFAGKTGTAQVAGKADTSLFVGWGPAGTGAPPSHAIAVVIPEAGFGGDVAAPLSFRILAPASTGELPEACPVAEPERSRCEQRNAAAAEARGDDDADPGWQQPSYGSGD